MLISPNTNGPHSSRLVLNPSKHLHGQPFVWGKSDPASLPMGEPLYYPHIGPGSFTVLNSALSTSHFPLVLVTVHSLKAKGQ